MIKIKRMYRADVPPGMGLVSLNHLSKNLSLLPFFSLFLIHLYTVVFFFQKHDLMKIKKKKKKKKQQAPLKLQC